MEYSNVTVTDCPGHGVVYSNSEVLH